MALEKLFDEKGNVDFKRTNNLYSCAFSNGDRSLFKAIYDKTQIVPVDFGKDPLKYYGFFANFQDEDFIKELKTLSDNAYFKYSVSLANKDYKLFMSSMNKGILPEEVYYNPKNYFSKVEKLKKEDSRFSEPLDKLKNLYELYVNDKYSEAIKNNSPIYFFEIFCRTGIYPREFEEEFDKLSEANPKWREAINKIKVEHRNSLSLLM